MSTLTYNPITYNGLSFTNETITETDVGTAAAFTSFPGIQTAVNTTHGVALSWGGVNAGVYYANSSETLNFNYNVSSTSAASLIDTVGQIYTSDQFVGPGVSLIAVENVFTTAGVLIGTETFNLASNANLPLVVLSSAQQTINVQITLTLAIDATGTSASTVIVSAFQQSFGTIPAASGGGSTATIGNTVWLDANNDGVLDNGEVGKGGVTVDLLNASTGAILATTTTNATGNYQFTGLAAGTYEVQVVAPTGDTFSPENVATTTGINSEVNASGLTAPITLTSGEIYNNANAGLVVPTGSIGNTVWLDANHDGLDDNGEVGVAGVTVDLLNATTSAILATTTTNATGNYQFTGLAAGAYEVKVIAPTGDIFTKQNVATTATAGINSVVNTSGLTAPITLAAGQIDNQVNAGLQTASGISVLKMPCSVVVNQCGQVTYTFNVTNTGTTALTNVKITDNIGSSANPDNVTPTLVTTGTNGVLAAGQTWVYTETVNQINCTPGGSGTVCHTATGGNLTAGCTAWLHSSFNPTSCADGATYKFQGLTCSISGSGVGSTPLKINCPDAVVTFSRNCYQPTTVFNASNNCWVTTLPANCNPGSVFLTGCPTTVPSGSNLTNATVTWSVGDASNNCGVSKLSWDGACTGYQNFTQNGTNGGTDYNQIGVKSCDNYSSYGTAGNCNIGYGYDDSWGYTDIGYNSYGGGCGQWSNSSGWLGTASDNSGTPENQYTGGNCGNTTSCNNYSYVNSCGTSYSATQNTAPVAGAADTVTVTAQAVTGTTTTTSGGCYGGTTTTVVTTGATVSASDTKEVQVLGSNSNVSVNGTPTTASLSATYGAAKTLEFNYAAGNTVSLTQVQAGMASVTGTNSSGLAFMEISNNANPFASGATIYFQGAVTTGENIYADATTNVLTNNPIVGGQFSSTAGSDIFAYVFSSQAAFLAGAAAVQTMAYNVSGSQAMHINDTIGSLQVIGYVGATGGHLTS